MLGSMSPELHRALENYKAYDMIQEPKTMFEEQAKKELFETVNAFHACKQEEGQSEKTPVVLAIRKGKIQKDKKKPKWAKGKDNGKNKPAYAPKPKISSLPKRDNPTKDSVCHQCKEVGHWRRNCPSYQAELKKRKNASGLRGSMKLKHEALRLYMGNGMRTVVKAIGSFDLVLPSGLIIILDNYPKETICYYFYYSLKNKIFVARNAKFFENSLMVQEASGSHGLLESSESGGGLELIREEEAEYIAAAEASIEAVWIRKFIDGLGNVVPSNKRPM
uniref:CCHC-type domain-containing protein n=1 Tax=Tanacetum cinerariifolium TaxID=118510 RepID=A0A6L2P2S3_TANCI|nr:hypothetical protein [Tanacetum cinerariifolium]